MEAGTIPRLSPISCKILRAEAFTSGLLATAAALAKTSAPSDLKRASSKIIISLGVILMIPDRDWVKFAFSAVASIAEAAISIFLSFSIVTLTLSVLNLVLTAKAPSLVTTIVFVINTPSLLSAFLSIVILDNNSANVLP